MSRIVSLSGAPCLVLALAAAACIGGVKRGYPLYTLADPPLEPNRVARLSGYVHDVDGEDVTEHGSTFELLPGCHVVGTLTKWGAFDPRSGGVVAETGRWVFAFPMRAGYSYSVSVDVEHFSGPTGDVTVLAREMDAEGRTTRNFGPVKSAQDLSACKNGVASTATPAR